MRLPDNTFLTGLAGKTRTEIDIFLGYRCSGGKSLPRGPYFLLGRLLSPVVIEDVLADELLEEERSLFHDWVHFPIDKDAGIDVLLGKVAKRFVF